MKRILSGGIFIIIFLLTGHSIAQTPKRICVMGSSSTYGYFGNPEVYPRDSGWAFKLKKYYKELGIIDTIYNIGVLGADPYIGMPSSYVPPPGRDLPDPKFNITKAVNFIPKPDVIIVNFPTNHYDWLTPAEIINCLQVIKDSANAKNIKCYITTTQPRDNFSPSERQKLKDLKTLIETTFGVWAIDFWTGAVVDSNLKIKPELAFGDLVHLNPAGHTILFNKVVAKNMFFSVVPANFGTVNAKKQGNKILVNWQIFQELNTEKYVVEKSSNGTNFTAAGTVESKGNSNSTRTYNFIDLENGNGNKFYRIAAVNYTGDVQYSAIVRLNADPAVPQAAFIFPTVTSDKITLVIESANKEIVQLMITDALGKKVQMTTATIQASQPYPISVAQLAPGTYVLTTEFAGKRQSNKFIKY
jgi:hypothetical protein